jgi:hypothetical protein
LIANYLQADGRVGAQYERAVNNARALNKAGIVVEFTGHSLGGGLATAQAIVSGYKAVVYNPSGVRVETVKGYDLSRQSTLVTQIVVKGEFLSQFQNSSPEQRLKLAGGLNAALHEGGFMRKAIGLPSSADINRVAANTPRASGQLVSVKQVEWDIVYGANSGVKLKPTNIGRYDAHKVTSVLDGLAYTQQK